MSKFNIKERAFSKNKEIETIENANSSKFIELEIGQEINGNTFSITEIRQNIYEFGLNITSNIINHNNYGPSFANDTMIIFISGNSTMCWRILDNLSTPLVFKVSAIFESIDGNLDDFDTSSSIFFTLIYKKIN